MDQSFKYKLILAYDGGNYCGWQLQSNAISIQGILEQALEKLMHKKIRVIGAGRTDAGVHAAGQTAHIGLDTPVECTKLHHSLNGMLPHDIRIKKIEAVDKDFHAQYSAISKEYHYHVCFEKFVDPFMRNYSHHFPYPISISMLHDAAKLFIGTHDFTSFANVGSKVRSAVRTIHRIDPIFENHEMRFEFEGNGFLYKMVRNIVGTILEVASGKRSIEDIPLLFEKKDRRLAGKAVPAKGLFLMRVAYIHKQPEESVFGCAEHPGF